MSAGNEREFIDFLQSKEGGKGGNRLMLQIAMGIMFSLFLVALILIPPKKRMKRLIIRLLTFLEIIPLKLFLRQWAWILIKLKRI